MEKNAIEIAANGGGHGPNNVLWGPGWGLKILITVL